jgi:hypothetical protein
MTITLDDRHEIPLHPLDLTAEPQGDGRASFCIGLIQAADSVLATPNSVIGDMILGVPFMRNAYTVMAYAIPDENGTFPVAPPASGDGNGSGEDSRPIRPRLGLLPLTQPSQALEEFNRVRVLNQPIESGSPANVGGGAGGVHDTVGPKKLSVGIIVLVCLVGFFALCFLLFGIRWFLIRRRWRRDGTGGPAGAGLAGAGMLGLGPATDRKEGGGYTLARRGSREVERGEDRELGDIPSEDVLRKLRYDAYMNQTLVGAVGNKELRGDEMGYRDGKPVTEFQDPWDPSTAVGREGAGWGDDTLVGAGGVKKGQDHVVMDAIPVIVAGTQPVRDGAGYGYQNHERHRQEEDTDGDEEERVHTPHPPHRRIPSVVFPLLLPGHGRADSEDEVDEFGVGGGGVASMAGVGTAARGGKIDAALRQSVVSAGSVYSVDGPGGRRSSDVRGGMR